MRVRRVLSFLIYAGAVVGVAIAVLWWGSGHRVDVFIAPRAHGDCWLVTSELGVFVIERQQQQNFPATGIEPTWVYFTDPLPRRWPGDWRFAGFGVFKTSIRHYVELPASTGYAVAIPHWFLMLITIAPGARRWLVNRRRQARRAAGVCEGCGYDLRESPERCPECGRDIQKI